MGLANCEELGRDLETLTQRHRMQMEDIEKQLRQSQIKIQTLQGDVNQAGNTDQDGNSGTNTEQAEMLNTIQELDSEVEKMEARCEEAEGGRRKDGEESEADINSLLAKVQRLTAEKQDQAQELREQQRVCDTITVEWENWEAEKESFDKEL